MNIKKKSFFFYFYLIFPTMPVSDVPSLFSYHDTWGKKVLTLIIISKRLCLNFTIIKRHVSYLPEQIIWYQEHKHSLSSKIKDFVYWFLSCLSKLERRGLTMLIICILIYLSINLFLLLSEYSSNWRLGCVIKSTASLK